VVDLLEGSVPDIPRRAVTRTAKLAALPLGVAGRATLGIGRRLGGRPAEIVTAEIQARTAEQLFRVLGELKGGAMKLGQALSVFEAALPEPVAAPYRATLTRLQEAAPPLPEHVVHYVLAQHLGSDWRDRFTMFDSRAAAAASIGQVHRGVWYDGREVAVKIQYPGAGAALLGDPNQISRLSRVFGALIPGLDIQPLIAELKARVADELDYTLEARSQRGFAAAYAGDPDICVPHVVRQAGDVLVTEWIDGTPLSEIIAKGSRAERDRTGLLLTRFLLSGPRRARMLHADPHPGNFRLLTDGRLGVLDFGAVDELPQGLPECVGRLVRRVLEGDAARLLAEMREEGFIRDSVTIEADRLLAYLSPFFEPLRHEEFEFSRGWLRQQATRIGDPRSADSAASRQFNLPPEYLLIHRVWLGACGVLSQLGSHGRWREELDRWVPGLAAPSDVDEGSGQQVAHG
jgi:predicted unusual protein kinase regulating ubiquinone biosynthesis (AarF/ABC1/UbiB family)